MEQQQQQPQPPNYEESEMNNIISMLQTFISMLENIIQHLKGHSGADWPVFFSRSIKSLIYNIFTYNVWTLNFYRKRSEIWSFILMLGNSGLMNSAGRSRAVR